MPRSNSLGAQRKRIHLVPQTSAEESSYRRCVNPFLASLLEDLSLDKRFPRGQGTSLFDSDDNEYLDGISQYGALPFGYNPPRIWDALDAVRRSGEPNFAQPSILDAAGDLAERLLRHAPGMAYVCYANSGSEAVEAAIKIARSSTGRRTIVSTHGGYHGKTLGALSATGREEYQKEFGAPAGGFTQVPFGDADAIARALGDDPDVAAVLLEPIQGEGGVVVPPDGYLAEVERVCRKRKVLLLIDEVQTGLGRTVHAPQDRPRNLRRSARPSARRSPADPRARCLYLHRERERKVAQTHRSPRDHAGKRAFRHQWRSRGPAGHGAPRSRSEPDHHRDPRRRGQHRHDAYLARHATHRAPDPRRQSRRRRIKLHDAGAKAEIIEGDVVDLPGAPDLGFGMGLQHGQAFACMAETMLLALEGRLDLPLCGTEISVKTIETIRRAAQKHNFRIRNKPQLNHEYLNPQEKDDVDEPRLRVA